MRLEYEIGLELEIVEDEIYGLKEAMSLDDNEGQQAYDKLLLLSLRSQRETLKWVLDEDYKVAI